MLKFKLLNFGYLITVIALFFYSFTQVDLNLTLSQWSIEQVVKKFFQHIGYFNRLLSTSLFIAIIVLLFIFYGLFLFLSGKNKINKRQIWHLIIPTSAILIFSYNAFSYDIFNYIFDAKIITYYHQNPYLYRALDFPRDPMLSFMHWTHRYYPYGPIWLVLTVPLSFIGFNYFLFTFFLFKSLGALSYLGTAFFISKILRKVSPKDELFGLIFFAMNPLIIVEGLVSSHNEMPMIFFAMLSLFLFFEEKYTRSFISLLLSAGIKFVTILLFPVYLINYIFSKKNKKINFELTIIPTTILMAVAVIVASLRTNFQPWYLLFAIPFASLTPKKYYIFIPTFVMSFFAILEYSPFLLKGDWNPPVPLILSQIMMISIVGSAVLVIGWKIRRLLVL